MKHPKTISLTFLFLLFLCLFPLFSLGQEEAAEEAEAEAPADDAGAEPAAEGGGAPAASGELRYALGVSLQSWSPFSAVTSSAITEVAGVTGAETEGKNTSASLRSEEVTTQNVVMATLEIKGGDTLDDLKLDLTDSTDFSRLNPFQSRAEESSKKNNLERSLKNEQPQTSRLDTSLNLFSLAELFNLVAGFKEENFVSAVEPTKDALFISFSGSEALIKENTNIQLETSFESIRYGIGKFDVPGTEIPVDFAGQFSLAFQKPILLNLPVDTQVEDNGETFEVDSVIIFPQFSATGWMLEKFKSSEEGWDVSGYLAMGEGHVSIGDSSQRVNELLGREPIEGNDDLFDTSAAIQFYGGLLRLGYIGETFEITAASEWRVFVLTEEFNGTKSQKPLSVDLISSLEALIRF